MTVFIAFFCNILFSFAVGLLVAKYLGPAEYGRFALAHATAIAVQTAFFDWVRLGATRFYSERARSEQPALRATLDFGFAFIALAISAGAALLVMSGVTFTLSNGLIVLAIGVAIANGLFDYYTALVRARFHDRLFARLLLVKNIMTFALMGGGAFWFASAKMTLIGGIVSLAGSVITARAALHDPMSDPKLASLPAARALMAYSLPIVAANVLYLSIPLANRAILASLYGFSETGQFSLAYDFGAKAIQAVGSALDVVLFQIAVATHELRGPTQARRQVGRNMTIVFAMVLPACTGIWLTLPSVESLIVPEQFRGHFGPLLTLMMTGLFCMAMIQYAINPIFQIEKKTGPLIVAALVACVVDPLLIVILPREAGASGLAIAQAGALLASLVTLVAFAGAARPRWPRLRDIVAIIFGNAAMAAALLPLRESQPGLATLAAQISLGAAVYALIVMSSDIAGMRALALAQIRLAFARRKAIS
ncbi:membrane protein involved in the export of O-antigen and teichoic acid-like protein [Methylocella silvestris BL2]|uniref:Membrane protein involved in the export of O-antigen and teichoic acid-like protein n=1 Tax=Methylocella silvestris (strain DSM 15510 / CIP 108128 / LMG 27833 / NCIMB 13906 / BL2) TaxID=395965 RepID=B8ERH5_METSB|nr:lipopolysaccharide biosynthesis protein [Methylocella silvestris]ACK51027.1 membrane protein involved in the export of O-antigen and teichoic acid-like protein [Methylocella silvestris BL2]